MLDRIVHLLDKSGKEHEDERRLHLTFLGLAGDIVCRYGGEEFILVLPGMKAEDGRTQAERLRMMIASLTVSGRDQLVSVTISIGGSFFPDDGTSSDELIDVADRALYRAKQNGRNRVEFAEPDDQRPQLIDLTSHGLQRTR